MKTRVFPNWLAAASLAVGLNCVPSLLAQNQSHAPSALSNGLEGESSAPATDSFSPWTRQILKLSQAGIEDGVVLSFIDNTAGTFNLDADQVVRLSHLGVSSGIISAMIQHDSDIAGGWRTVTPSTVPGKIPLHLVSVTNDTDSAQQELQPATQADASTGPIQWAEQRSEATSAQTTSTRLSFASATSESVFPNEAVSCSSTESRPRALAASSNHKEPDYRVRKPYPEEIMEPIVVLRGWAPPANTVLISMFPHSTR